MKRMSCIIVEDEPASQEILEKYIHDYGELALIAVCNNATEAYKLLHLHTVDVMFLDITMPQLSGLDFYNSLADPPKVIFTTAYPQYAVHGFEVNAVDYLVKPFGFDRFLTAMNKLPHQLKSDIRERNGFILLQADKKMHKVNYDDIQYLEASGDYVKVHLSGKMLMVHFTLQKLLSLLPARDFLRIHKSFAISLHKVQFIEGNMVIVAKHSLPIGSTYRQELLATLSKRNE